MNPPSMPVSNRRASRRKGLRCACELILPGQATRQATTVDIGLDGLSFLCAKPIAPGTRCRINLELPLDEHHAVVSGSLRTVYSSFCGDAGFKIGALFTELDVGGSALRDFCGLDGQGVGR